MVKFDKDELIAGVHDECRQGKIPLEEDVVSFLLGHYLEGEASEVGFQIAQVSTDLFFSPDVDVLEFTGSKLVGYEVKGIGGEDQTEKQALYKGLGQATALLTQPVDMSGIFSETGVFSETYLVCPPKYGGSEQWQSRFRDAVEKSPAGFATIDPNNGLEIQVEANEIIPRMCQSKSQLAREKCIESIHDKMRSLLHEKCTGYQKPSNALMKIAYDIADDYGSSDPILGSLG